MSNLDIIKEQTKNMFEMGLKAIHEVEETQNLYPLKTVKEVLRFYFVTQSSLFELLRHFED